MASYPLLKSFPTQKRVISFQQMYHNKRATMEASWETATQGPLILLSGILNLVKRHVVNYNTYYGHAVKRCIVLEYKLLFKLSSNTHLLDTNGNSIPAGSVKSIHSLAVISTPSSTSEGLKLIYVTVCYHYKWFTSHWPLTINSWVEAWSVLQLGVLIL